MIVSLCDRTGNMVKPWAAAGFDCLCIDTRHPIRNDTVEGRIVKRWGDVRSITPADLPKRPRFIAAFPPCTNLAVSGARDFERKGLQGFIDALQIVEACRRLCEWFGCPWMIENPVSRLSTAWRKPDHIFQPWQYGDPYRKRTCLWTGGGFVMPPPMIDSEPAETTERILLLSKDDPDRKDKRSETPLGFAHAVYKANRNKESDSL